MKHCYPLQQNYHNILALFNANAQQLYLMLWAWFRTWQTWIDLNSFKGRSNNSEYQLIITPEVINPFCDNTKQTPTPWNNWWRIWKWSYQRGTNKVIKIYQSALGNNSQFFEISWRKGSSSKMKIQKRSARAARLPGKPALPPRKTWSKTLLMMFWIVIE